MSDKPRVLVVDDSLTVRMDLRAVLSTAGFTVTACSSKAEALRALKIHHFHLVVLDILLPDGSGIDILKDIKQTPSMQSTHVFMLSTEDEAQSRIQGLRLGADLYVGKPYDRGYVVRAARELFKMSDYAGPPTSRRSLSHKNILVVDDSPSFASALSMVLRQDGNQVVVASSGADALALLAVERFDCVLVDVVMDGLDGFETCRRLRTLPRMEHAPVALMTTSNRFDLNADAVAAGADELFIKPVDLRLMSEQLRTLLIKKHQQLHGASSDAAAGTDGATPLTLYQQIVAKTGLSEGLSRSIVDRALQHVGSAPADLNQASLHRALPLIRDSLSMFLSAEETTRRMAELALCGEPPAVKLAASGPPPPPDAMMSCRPA